jgi:hypothetical protein
MDDREPAAGDGRPSDDEMTGHDVNEPTPDEVERGRAALQELGVEPLPSDVLARLEGRLEGELGRVAPVRRRRRLPRLLFALPGAGAAVAAAIVVAVIATHDGSSRPTQHESALSVRAKSAPASAPSAGAGGAADSRSAAPAPSATFALQVRVPSLVGHGLGYVRAVTAAHRLRWAFAPGATCPPVPASRVTSQRPRARAVVPAGTTVRISIGTCQQASGGG